MRRASRQRRPVRRLHRRNRRPRSWLAPYGFGTLGCALPMAIGASIASPDRPVLAIV
ncbi:MAG: thiamine pyrophosphate-dependent enzyme, partial [Actinomycetota bacterium]